MKNNIIIKDFNKFYLLILKLEMSYPIYLSGNNNLIGRDGNSLNLHKRNGRNEQENINEEYDQESGNYVDNKQTNLNNHYDNKKYNLLVKFFMSIAIFGLIFGFYVDIFSKSNKNTNDLENSNINFERKLKENHVECLRNDFENISKYIQCLAESSHILIISDTSEHIEIKDKYHKYDIDFRHINDIFTNVSDYSEFIKILEEKSPWVFVEGTYIGNEKELELYNEHDILNNGIEHSDIKPTLNENEINLLSSSKLDEDNINILKVRQYLRRHLPSKEVDKEMYHIKHLIQAHKNIRTENKINEETQ